MKKIVLAAILLIMTFGLIRAQVPQAFKYQAIARDLSGNVLSGKTVALRVSILSGTADGSSVYSETHTATTNNFGLVNLDIGLGSNRSGTMSSVNWSSGAFYLKIEMDETGGTNFKPMGVSQLLSVPYALYSGSATGVTPPSDNGGVPSNVWSLFGNRSSNPPTDHLGTVDAADLVVITNDIERMKIRSDGNIEMARSLSVGEDLTVKHNVYLNTISGSTINNGPFTVAKLSPTLLSGSLVVDLATDLNSSLNVDGITDLNSAFHVNNASPSTLSGTLLLQGDGTFNQHLLLDNAALGSTNYSTGALVVKGGVGIGENLNVFKNATIGGSLKLGGALTITDTTSSTSTTTGALKVAGGVGIGKQLNVGGQLNANAQVTITANPGSGSQSNYIDYPLLVQGSKQGIAIKVPGTRNGDNNYVSFWDDDGMQGRIEGETSGEVLTDPQYIYDMVIFGIDAGINICQEIQAVTNVVAASTSATGCVGLGVCVTAPIPSFIVGDAANLILQSANLALSLSAPIAYNAFRFANIGVTYSSGSGDYAEWLMKANPSEKFSAGDIVGVTGGRISHTTEGAEKLMVVSLKPIVLGNMPEPGKENLYEKVAFMGQVPVRIFGPVKSGDFIIPAGFNNGLGLAVSADKLKPEDYSRIVGIAWSVGNDQINTVNVAVGLNNGQESKLVARQQTKINELENQLSSLQAQFDHTNQELARLIPGFTSEKGQTGAVTTQTQGQPVTGTTPQTSGQPASKQNVTITEPADRTVVSFEVTDDQLKQAYDLAEKMMVEKGVNLDTHPFFKKTRTDQGYKETYLNQLKKSLNQAIKDRSVLNSKSGSQVEIH